MLVLGISLPTALVKHPSSARTTILRFMCARVTS
jgi:hypothetical protein